MQLMFKRTKIFMIGNKRYVGSIGADGRAPEWIRDTDTFKMGVSDGSIIDFKAVAEAQEAEAEVEESEPAAPKVPSGFVRGNKR